MSKFQNKSILSNISSFRIIHSEYWILAGIFLLAVLLRIYLDPTIPYHYDPGKNIVYAHAALSWFPLFPESNPFFNMREYFEYQALLPYLTAFFNKILGIPLVTAITWIALLSGAALTITVFLFIIEAFQNKTAALISAFLIAVSQIQILQYMNYYPQILATTLMPLAFLYLIRYFRSGDCKSLFIVSIFSSLIILASYLTAFMYLSILLISLALWSFSEKKARLALFFIPLTTLLFLSFFWVPMVTRHGILTIVSDAVLRIVSTTGSFTNQEWTLSTFLSYSGSTLIAIVAVIILFLTIKKLTWDFQKVLLSVWLFLSLVFMISYLVRPILWVDRFFPFLDIAAIIVAGVALSLIINLLNTMKSTAGWKRYLILLILLIPLFSTVQSDVVFFSWGYPSDYAMTEYMSTNLNPSSLIVAPPGIQGYWVSALSGLPMLGGDPAQMIGHQYLGDPDSETIINSPDVEKKMELIRKYGVKYIYIPIHKGIPTIWAPTLSVDGVNGFENTSYFEIDKILKDNYGRTILIKVKNSTDTPYNPLFIDWPVIILGYLISLISAVGLFFIIWSGILEKRIWRPE